MCKASEILNPFRDQFICEILPTPDSGGCAAGFVHSPGSTAFFRSPGGPAASSRPDSSLHPPVRTRHPGSEFATHEFRDHHFTLSHNHPLTPSPTVWVGMRRNFLLPGPPPPPVEFPLSFPVLSMSFLLFSCQGSNSRVSSLFLHPRFTLSATRFSWSLLCHCLPNKITHFLHFYLHLEF